MATVDLPMTSNLFMEDATPTTNYSTGDLYIGEYNAGAFIWRAIVKPDFTSVPIGAAFTSAILKLTPKNDYSDNARTMSAHRVLRTVVFNQATWNVYSTGNNWGTAGCSNSTTDYDGAIALGTMTQPASPTLNTALEMTFTSAGLAELQKMWNGTYINNGIALFVATQTNDAIRYYGKDDATATYRPVISLTYNLAGGAVAWFWS